MTEECMLTESFCEDESYGSFDYVYYAWLL